jgi:uncharacterized delta-60 repeat protein
MKKLLPCLLLSLFFASAAFAVTEAWVARYDNASGDDRAGSIAVDSSGNVYVTGYSRGSGGNDDYATVKYNSSGAEQWVARYDNASNYDAAYSIAVDSSGNVYVTGYSVGSGGDGDYATIKYNSSGDQQWTARYDNASNDDVAKAIAVDASGNVYVTGYSRGSGGNEDYATIKYNSAGVQQWVARYNGPASSDDMATSIAVDSSGNVYVTGVSTNSGGNWDYATVKYNSAGVQQWASRYNGSGNGDDSPWSIAVDSSGNVYVTGQSTGSGTSLDCATIKYDSTGAEQWVATYNGPGNGNDWAMSIAVDSSGNVYVTGGSWGSGTSGDYATVKYNSFGAEQWVARYDNASNYEEARSIAVDSSGNVYVTGVGVGSGTGNDYATVKYNSSGAQQWVQRYDGPASGSDLANVLAIDGSGNIYVTGQSRGFGGDYDYATIKYSEPDTQSPSVGAVSPNATTQNILTQFNVTATDNIGVTDCDFYWDDASNGSMVDVGGNIWAKNYTSTSSGSHYAWANCSDAAGNTNKTNTTITVNAPAGGAVGATGVAAAPEADLFLVTVLFCLAILVLGARKWKA